MPSKRFRRTTLYNIVACAWVSHSSTACLVTIELTKAALIVTAAATLAHLQTMRQSMTAVFAEEPVLGGSGVIPKKIGPGLWEQRVESDEGANPHQADARVSLTTGLQASA